MGIKLERPLAIFDLETTGTNFVKDRIVEIYIKKVFPDGKVDVFHSLVNPKLPIPKEASEIHGITDDKVADEPTFFKLAFELESFLKDADLAGFNSNYFDIPMLLEEFHRVGIDFDVSNRKQVDVFKIFQKKEKRDLSAAYQFYCNKELIDAHSASADVEATYEILQAQIERYDDLESNVDFLHEFSNDGNFVDTARRLVKENGEIRFNFGKHKGKSVKEVLKLNPQYYDWMMKSDFAFDTKKKLTEIREQLLD